MTWAKLDDRLWADPRTEAAGLDAFGLFAAALSWMGAYSTPAIGVAQVKKIAGRRTPTLAAKLVAAGFWCVTDAGWALAEPGTYLRLIPRDKSDLSPEISPTSVSAIPPPLPVDEGNPTRGGASDLRSPDPIPTRSRPEIPDHPTSQGSLDAHPRVSKGEAKDEAKAFALTAPEPKGGKRKKPATELPEGWGPNADHFTLGRSLGFGEKRVRSEADQFRDRNRAKGELYVDWHAAFSTWLRNQRKFDDKAGIPPEKLELVEHQRMRLVPPSPGKPHPPGTTVCNPAMTSRWLPAPEPKPEPTAEELREEAEAEAFLVEENARRAVRRAELAKGAA